MSERWFVGEDAARDARRCHRRSWAATRASYWTHICLPLPLPRWTRLPVDSSANCFHPVHHTRPSNRLLIAGIFILLLLFIRANCCPAICVTFLRILGPLQVHPLILQSICHKPMQALFEALTLPLTLASL